MELSIVISTYNNAVSLIRTLQSVVKQDADKSLWECVVVNNASTDDTESRFEAFANEYKEVNLRMVNESQQGLSYARNRGVKESKGAFVAFIDDDETINEGFVSAYLEAFHEYGAFAAAGRVVACYETARPKWMSYYTEKMIANPMDLGNKIATIVREVVPAGGNMAFNREVFTLYGGFNTSLGRKGKELLGGEENEFFSRIRNLGERIFYVPNAVVYHHIPDRKLTPEYFDKLSYGVGVSKRLRAENEGVEQELLRDERRKRLYTILIAIFYILTLRPHKAAWLWRMRRGISKGIFGE